MQHRFGTFNRITPKNPAPETGNNPTVALEHVFVDPSIALRNDDFTNLLEACLATRTTVYATSLLKPGSNVYRQREWETFCRSFGVTTVPEAQQVAGLFERQDIQFFGLEDARLAEQDFVDVDKLRLLASQGSFAQVEAEEIGFLLSHSVIAARTKRREHALFERWKSLQNPGKRVIHITVVGFDGSIQQLPMDVARVIPWVIVGVKGTVLLALLGSLFPPIANSAEQVGSWAAGVIALVSYQWTHP